MIDPLLWFVFTSGTIEVVVIDDDERAVGEEYVGGGGVNMWWLVEWHDWI